MNFLSFFRIVFLPILLLLSIVYGLMAFIFNVLMSFRQVKLSGPVISVGNFCVGGSGKTPIVGELIQWLDKNNYTPIVILKSYKSFLKSPLEVFIGADFLKFGDEAVALKQNFKDVRVFSGPIKFKTALYADERVDKKNKNIFIIDDGAQHNRIRKDIKIHIWDLSRPLIDILPFPLGASREFWFLGERPDLSILNRSRGTLKEKLIGLLIYGKKIKSLYKVNNIVNAESFLNLNKDFNLISGIGNFEQFLSAVKVFLEGETYSLIKKIKGSDHDDFKWFRAEQNINYVCTQKDLVKLKNIVEPENLFVVRSEFSKDFKKEFSKVLEKILLKKIL